MHLCKNVTLFCAFFMMAFAVLAPSSVRADTNIAVVSIQKIMSDSRAAKSIQSQLDKQRKSFQDEFSKHERDLMESEKKLVEQRSSLPPEEFTLKKQEFENKILETRKLVQKRQRALEQAAGEALGTVRNKMVDIVSDMAASEGYDLVVTKQYVILSQKELDITDKVLDRLNKDSKEVKLNISTN